MTEAKFCPYCMVEHEEKGRYCCPAHAARAGAQLRSQAAGRRYAINRGRAKVQASAGKLARWRQVALGVDVSENLRAIFGRDVTP